MSIPQLMLLAFALWTLLVPLGAIALYRWSRILRGLQSIETFRSDAVEGADWYRRAMRAHANCVENLPVFAVMVWSVSNLGLDTRVLDVLAIAIMASRVVQSLVHISSETRRAVSTRFSFFFVQFLAMLTMGGMVLDAALSVGR